MMIMTVVPQKMSNCIVLMKYQKKLMVYFNFKSVHQLPKPNMQVLRKLYRKSTQIRGQKCSSNLFKTSAKNQLGSLPKTHRMMSIYFSNLVYSKLKTKLTAKLSN